MIVGRQAKLFEQNYPLVGLERGKPELSVMILPNHKTHRDMTEVANSIEQDDVLFCLFHLFDSNPKYSKE